MPRPERARDNMAHNGPRESYGPSYYDVAELAAEIEAMEAGVVSFTVRPAHLSQRWGNRQWQCVANFTPREAGTFVPVHHGSYFRGNAGFDTLPATMYDALSKLYTEVEAGLQIPLPIISPAE